MLNNTEFGSHGARNGRIPVPNLASGRLATMYDIAPSAQFTKDMGPLNIGSTSAIIRPQIIDGTESRQTGATRTASATDRRKVFSKPVEHGLLRSFSAHISFIQRLFDGLLITGIYCAALTLHRGVLNAEHLLGAVLAVLLFLTFAEMYGLYKSWRTSPQSDEIHVLVSTWIMMVGALLLLAFATKTSDIFSRWVVIVWCIATPLALTAVRLIRRAVLSFVRAHGANTRSVAIVGNNAIGHRLIQHFDATPWAGLVVKGFFDARRTENSSVEVHGQTFSVGSIDDLQRQARSGEIDSVYIALPLSSERIIEDVVHKLSDTTASVYVIPDSFASELMHARWIDFGGLPMLSVHETPFYGLHSWLKRAEDIVLSSLILVLISPLMLGIAVAIKATSPGNVLFKQRRYGLNGAVVEVWKFRSMTVCEDDHNLQQAKKGDKRVTPLGAFLRRTSLDELPQFFNVLQGSMSVIGPRPHAVTHNEEYRQLIKGYMLRHKVKPGISGWAQINGWRGETDTLEKMKKRVEFDMEYIQNWTLWFDLKIVFFTLFRGFVGKNAY
jgi:putative colanic acid biosynthesis UDP-glucose lipid carrier transferase